MTDEAGSMTDEAGLHGGTGTGSMVGPVQAPWWDWYMLHGGTGTCSMVHLVHATLGTPAHAVHRGHTVD